MPSTNLFSGYSYKSISRGSIAVTGSRNIATIEFRDPHHEMLSTATLTAYTLDELKNTVDYRNALQANVPHKKEIFITPWTTLRYGNTLVLFSTEDQVALVLTSVGGDVEKDFTAIAQHDFFANTDYVKQKWLLSKLSGYGVTADHIHAMDDTHRRFYLQNTSFLCELLASKFSIEQLSTMSLDTLELFLSERYAMAELMRSGIKPALLFSKMDRAHVKFYLANMRFLSGLVELKFSEEQLSRMGLDRLELLLSNDYKIRDLMRLGVSPEKVCRANITKLTNYFNNTGSISGGVLKLVSIEQILGLNDVPPPIITDPSIDLNLRFGGSTGSGEFTLTERSGRLDGTHKDQETGVVSKIVVHYKTMPITGNLQKYERQTLLHDWYVLTNKLEPTENTESAGKEESVENAESVKEKIIFYCPARKCAVMEEYDSAFPKDAWIKRFGGTSAVPYYQEQQLVSWLTEWEFSVEQFKALPGMTPGKLELLCARLSVAEELLEKGLKLTDFAAMDENCLRHLIVNSFDINSALTWVDVKTLCRIPAPISPRAAMSLFPPASNSAPSATQLSSAQPEEDHRKGWCRMM